MCIIAYLAKFFKNNYFTKQLRKAVSQESIVIFD